MSSTIPPEKTSKLPARSTSADEAGDAGLVMVRVFHNLTAAEQDRYPCEYLPGDRAVQVFATPAPRTAEHLAVCEAVWELLNVGDDPAFTVTPDPRAVAYRKRGNRSMSFPGNRRCCSRSCCLHRCAVWSRSSSSWPGEGTSRQCQQDTRRQRR